MVVILFGHFMVEQVQACGCQINLTHKDVISDKQPMDGQVEEHGLNQELRYRFSDQICGTACENTNSLRFVCDVTSKNRCIFSTFL